MKYAGSSLLQLQAVTKVFKTTAGDVTVLKQVSTQIAEGEFVSIVGRSGSGKSTLVNMVTGIDHPTSGTVQIGGVVLHRMREGQLSIWRGKNLGIVFQFFQLLPTLTLLENVLLPMDLANYLQPVERVKRAMDLLKLVELDSFADKMPAELSGGQQQSAAIARALANDPPVIVADEPTGNLDSQTAENIFHVFTNLAGQGKTILMVTHDRSLASRAARSMVICDGELVNEMVSSALPDLDHTSMLNLTHGLIPWDGENTPGRLILIFVEAGELHLSIHDQDSEIPLDVIGAGGILSTLGLPEELAGRIRLQAKSAVLWQVAPDVLRDSLSAANQLGDTLAQKMNPLWTRGLSMIAEQERGAG